MSSVDIIETFNARSYFNDKAKKVASRFKKLCSAGSDAHSEIEIGNAYIELPEFSDMRNFMTSLSQGIIHGHNSGPFVHFNSTFNKIKKRRKG
jgi:hypothetical protein